MVLNAARDPPQAKKPHMGTVNIIAELSVELVFFPDELWVVCKNGTPVMCVDGHLASEHCHFKSFH